MAMALKTKHYVIFGALVIVLVIAVAATVNVFCNSPKKTTGGNGTVDNTSSGDVQIVNLKMVNGYQYILEPSALKKGVKARMIADVSTMSGCMRSITIPAFNVYKTVSEKDNIIEFTPTKTGTFAIACSMNMGQGSFTVID